MSAGEGTPQMGPGLPCLGYDICVDRYDVGHRQKSHGACSELGDQVRLPVGHIEISSNLQASTTVERPWQRRAAQYSCRAVKCGGHTAELLTASFARVIQLVPPDLRDPKFSTSITVRFLCYLMLAGAKMPLWLAVVRQRLSCLEF